MSRKTPDCPSYSRSDATFEQSRSRRAALAEQLARHSPCDAEEAEHLRAMRALLEAEADPFSRESMRPGHFTASAFILSPDSRQLLLIFHSKLQRWLQPGGHVEPVDTSLQETALREAREEVGLADLELVQTAPLDLDVHVIPARKHEPAHRHFDVRFALRARNVCFTPGSDAQAARWTPLGALSAVESDRSVMRAAEKLSAR